MVAWRGPAWATALAGDGARAAGTGAAWRNIPQRVPRVARAPGMAA